uniref:Putative secreted protein n=1 Tax=Anopheles marajoara TaxID=58244 RepID=A0A2M4CAG0_9DIPT
MSCNFLATLMKWLMISARSLGLTPLSISCTVQKVVWLNRFVNATMLGAKVCLFFFVHPHPVSSSGWMALNVGKSNSVIWLASSAGDTC